MSFPPEGSLGYEFLVTLMKYFLTRNVQLGEHSIM